ncbi:hypothetical protein FOA52_005067 [Chlamydomonas sp. UWO 241]|nr:hypothetical protein FOA52_005067 [Chlamydomonas sp. UWO 241]
MPPWRVSVDWDAITIGRQVSFGGGAFFNAVGHDGVMQAIRIEDNVTLGAGVVVCPGVQMAKGTVAGDKTRKCDKTCVPPGRRLEAGQRMQGTLVIGGMGAGSGVPGSADGGTIGNPWYTVALQCCMILILVPMSLTLASVTITVLISAVISSPMPWTILAPVLIYPGAMIAGILVQVGWVLLLRLVLMPGGHSAAVSVFDIRYSVKQEVFGMARTQFDILQGTIYYAWIWRLLGAKIGKGVILMTSIPGEADILTIGDNAVLEANVSVDCHSIEKQMFEFAPIIIEDNAWLGQSSRLLPSTRMQMSAYLGCNSVAIKGEVFPRFSLWLGNPAVPSGYTGLLKFRAEVARVQALAAEHEAQLIHSGDDEWLLAGAARLAEVVSAHRWATSLAPGSSHQVSAHRWATSHPPGICHQVSTQRRSATVQSPGSGLDWIDRLPRRGHVLADVIEEGEEDAPPRVKVSAHRWATSHSPGTSHQVSAHRWATSHPPGTSHQASAQRRSATVQSPDSGLQSVDHVPQRGRLLADIIEEGVEGTPPQVQAMASGGFGRVLSEIRAVAVGGVGDGGGDANVVRLLTLMEEAQHQSAAEIPSIARDLMRNAETLERV